MQPRISFITLGVSDLARATAFYRDVLGLPQMPTPPDIALMVAVGVGFVCGGLMVVLQIMAAVAANQ